MIRFRRCLALMVLCLCALTALPADGPATRVRLVRMIVGEIVYNWAEGSAVPERQDGGYTHPAVIASFLGFKPGDSMAWPRMERLAREAEERLRLTGFFYNVAAMVAPSRQEPGSCNVIITITEGFTWRFGGGNAFAMAGQDNVAGLARSWRAALGYNLDGASYSDRLAFGLPLELGASFFYRNSSIKGLVSHYHGTFAAGARYRLSPDFYLGAKADIRYARLETEDQLSDWFPGGSSWSSTVSASAGFSGRAWLEDFSARYAAETVLGLSLPDIFAMSGERVRFATAKAVAVGGWPFLRLGLQASAAWSEAALDYGRRFDLASTTDASVRSPVAFSQGSPDSYALLNAELRGPELKFFLPPVFNVVAGPFLFSDLCLARRVRPALGVLGESLVDGAAPESASGSYFLDAFGGGLRFGFAAPVNVFFTLIYGWNRFGAGSLGFAVSGGF